MRMIWNLLITLLVIYLVYTLLLFIFQRSLIYPGQYRKSQIRGTISDDRIETIWLHNSFGKTEALLLKASDEDSVNRPVMIMAHGNFELIEDGFEEAMQYRDLGLHVLLVEYPGFGRSAGSPSYDSLQETFITAYDTIKMRNELKDNKIIAYGRSLGGGPVCLLAKHRLLDAIILQSSFSDIRKFAGQYFLPGFLLHDQFHNMQVLSEYENPVLILHGHRDQTIPYAHGIQLHDAALNSEFITYQCDHNDFPVYSGEHLRNLAAFLIKHQIVEQNKLRNKIDEQ